MNTRDKIKSKMVCVALAAVILLPMLIPLGLAYFEYSANRDVLINGDGSINQNAFGVLNDVSYRDDPGYGTTPENPFTIDNIDHLYNLIKLNNDGRLLKAKKNPETGKYDVPQYYFVLNFTSQDLPQVLDLDGIVIPSVGNNDYPFIDRLSGLLYAYCFTDNDNNKKYIYLSGLIKHVEVEVEGDTVKINGEESAVLTGNVQSGKYIKIPQMYIQHVEEEDKLTDGINIYVPLSSPNLKSIHNVIANATVRVPDDQIDVGFFNAIAKDTITLSDNISDETSDEAFTSEEKTLDIAASVRDVIFYNLTVECVEKEESSIWTKLKEIWQSFFGEEKEHTFEDSYNKDIYNPQTNPFYERHIGLFAGHIEGMVENITVAGECEIKIDSKDVNYYSAFTTVGFIHKEAIIGSIKFEDMLEEGATVSDVTGCMFADSIYVVAESEIGGQTQYDLTSIPASGTWKGVTAGEDGVLSFSYGSFHFNLSTNNDIVGKIWENGSEVKLLGDDGYIATKSVLYCNDEYRYSDSPQSGGALVPGAASANETMYQGMHTLIASGSVLDKGKYVIAAKVPAEGEYKYFALKIIAVVDPDNNNITYEFDISEKTDITSYINDNTGNISVYSSAVWQNEEDTLNPTFRNTRFNNQYLKINVYGENVTKALTEGKENAVQFRYNAIEKNLTHTLILEEGEGITAEVDFYLNFSIENGFYFSRVKQTDIEIYRLSNGFTIEPVDEVADITKNEDYLIAGKNENDYYLLGEKVEGTEVETATGNIGTDFKYDNGMPGQWLLDTYQSNRRYVWYATNADSSGIIFRDKVAASYYLNGAEDNLSLSLTPDPPSGGWVYTQNTAPQSGGRLKIGDYYLSFDYTSGSETTGFSLSDNPSTVYLFKLIPDDEDWAYNTYQGARLITTESSVVQSGKYLIAADTGSSYMGLVMNEFDEWRAQDITGYINGTGNLNNLTATEGTYAGFMWQVEETSAKPAFKNLGFFSYLSRKGNDDAALSDLPVEWLYNANSGRMYYAVKTRNGEETVTTLYYLAYTGTTFIITEGLQQGYNYNIKLYRVNYTYVYANVVPVQSLTYEDAVGYGEKLYFISTAPLTDMDNTAPYFLGSKSTEDGGPVESINIAPTSSYNGTTITTTTDLSYYRWKFNPRYSSGTNIYPMGYQFINDATEMYLAASTKQQSRTLVVAKESNIVYEMDGREFEHSSFPPTGMGLGGVNVSNPPPFYNTDSNGTYIGSCFYIRGQIPEYEYYVWKSSIPGVFELSLMSSKPVDYSYPYLYEASGYSINVSITPLSEKGDNLDIGKHYMITALKTDTLGNESYYALGISKGEEGNYAMYGINVTSQAVTINQSKIYDDEGNVIEEHSTDDLRMVPFDSDWYQMSEEKGLIFYHSIYSTNERRTYLTADSLNPSVVDISLSESAKPANWYYDAISKYLKYYDINDNCYYLAYDVSIRSFYFTDNINQASHIYIYQFKPKYKVSQVMDGENDSLKNGDFIIAAKSDESNDYTAIGVDSTSLISDIVTDYINKKELTETDYNEILNYIWKQQYYDFSSAIYNPDSSTQYMQLFSYITGGGFTTAYQESTGGLQTGADPMVWEITRVDGLWKFINNRVNGDVRAKTRAINYSGVTSNLQISDGYLSNAVYLNAFYKSVSFSSQGSSMYLRNTSGNIITSISGITKGDSYIICTESNGKTFMVRRSGTSISLVEFNLSYPTGCLWSASSNSAGIRLKNDNYYAKVNSNNAIIVSTNSTGMWLMGENGRLYFNNSNSTPRVLYENHFTTNSSGSNVYMYVKSGASYDRVTGGLVAGKAYALVISSGGTFNLVRSDGFGFDVSTVLGTSLPESLTKDQVGDNRFISVSSELGVYLYLQSSQHYLTLTSNNNVIFTSEKATQWQFSGNKLFVVSRTYISPVYLNITYSNRTYSLTTTSSNSQPTYIYSVTQQGGSYTTKLLSANMLKPNMQVVIVIKYNNNYFALARNGSNLLSISPATVNNGVLHLSSVNPNNIIIWDYDGRYFSYVSSGGTRSYLRRPASGNNMTLSPDPGFFEATYTTTAFTAQNTQNFTPLYIYKVTMSDELDKVTDTDTLLSSKINVKPSVSLLQSGRYVIVAEVDKNSDSTPDKYYSLGMVNAENTQSIDITSVMNNAKGGYTVTLFDSCVWEQRGSDLRLLFTNFGFKNDPYYLTGILGNRETMEPGVVHPDPEPVDFSDFIWRTYTIYEGENQIYYLFGFTETIENPETSENIERVYYLYFDIRDLKFRLTTNVSVAKNASSAVQLYQLSAETVNQPSFTTPIIKTEQGVIISYPINQVQSQDDLQEYSASDTDGDGIAETQGEYLIISKSGESYYAVTLSPIYSLTYVDVSPYFNGNYSSDMDGNPCLAINYNYIWRQTGSSSNLKFYNAITQKYLAGSQNVEFSYSIEDRTLYDNSTGKYLNFSVTGGFTFDSQSDGSQILLYYLGYRGIDTGSSGSLNYTYYATPISTSPGSSVTFNNFEYTKKIISELLNYAVGSNGFIEKSIGWSLDSGGEKLSEITTSVLLLKGVDYNPSTEESITNFADEFSLFESPYSIYDSALGELTTGTCKYYAPKGMMAFVVDQASVTTPVFVNVVVTTQFAIDEEFNLNKDYLRYLGLWRVADLSTDTTDSTATALFPYGNGSLQEDYANTLARKFAKPDFAIPLPNHYGSAESGASYAKVDGQNYVLSVEDLNEDYLIAHTFAITAPGVYYMGSTYGTLGISYISIDNAAEGEATGGSNFGSDFSIDICYGDLDETIKPEIIDESEESESYNSYVFSHADEVVEGLTYVGKTGWYHSNIFPVFVNGTQTIPTDYLDMYVTRILYGDNTSRVNITAYTKARLADSIHYINNNTIAQRSTRKVSFSVYCGGISIVSEGTATSWTVSKDQNSNRYRIYTNFVFGEKVSALFLGMINNTPVITAAGSYYWTCDPQGHLVSSDDRYLNYNSGEGFTLTDNPDNAILVYQYTGTDQLVQASGFEDRHVYFLKTADGNIVILDPS